MILSHAKSKCGTLTGDVSTSVNSFGCLACVYMQISREGVELRTVITHKVFEDAVDADNWMQEKVKNVVFTLLQA